MQTHVNGTNSFKNPDGTQEYVYVNQPVIQFDSSFGKAAPAEEVREGLREKDSVSPNQLTLREDEKDILNELDQDIDEDLDFYGESLIPEDAPIFL